MALSRSLPEIGRHTTGSVAPWKTEQIGFEQAGRVVYVIEPNEMVRPNVAGPDTSSGTSIGRLDKQRLQIAVESAKADVSIAKLKRDANSISVSERLPASISAAEAELQLADLELKRTSELGLQNAISRAELDTTRTRAKTASSQFTAAKAELLQAKAEQLAFEAQVVRVEQTLAEAERNLQNAVLFSSFPGIVSAVHAVPGSYVMEGDPVVTVQMTDPMLVEFEVTARNSRRYQMGDSLQVTVADAQGNAKLINGMVYAVDAMADAQSRTFTVTLHVRNELQQETPPQSSTQMQVAHTRRIYPLTLGPIVTGDDRLLVERSAIHSAGGEDFVWKITNRKWGTASADGDRLLKVERVPVRVTSEVIPFLGTWNFVTIEFADPATVDLEQDLVTGELYIPPDTTDESVAPRPVPEDWSGNQVMLDQPRWLLRPGDVVRVALLPETMIDGFYVPMKAVREENGATFVHVIDASQQTPTAKRVAIVVSPRDSAADESLLLRIDAANPDELHEGMQVVVGGTHYLDDGDRVRITPATGAER